MELDEYYLNLSRSDFSKRIDLASHFIAWTFSKSVDHLDLYFVGVKRGDGLHQLQDKMNAIFIEAKRIDASLELPRREKIGSYCKSRLRLVLANSLGNRNFRALEYAIRKLLRRV